ncbi:FimD/PapC C-terminal domain-containing protein [Pseudomonas sp. MSSRFD41]|uniref:FimD/PapC C-terminal domain-containing protein n=1 Tax=Pseudomonas sp. MSSRFD41 TaxID=1310370 RepID=UPI001C8B6706|nr:FimD/PapC C-terminal domain-containing protein [Pseudomonas sp. MSSRFD41]
MGETIALAQAPKANDVGFEIRPGVRTDKSGDAVIPNLSPYRVNRLALLTGDLGDEVEVKNAALDVVPTRGAVVKAKFATSVGYRLMMTLTNKDGSPLPFGSKIENELGQEVGIVGPDGQAFVTGASEKGNLRVMWSRNEKDQCTIPYQFTKNESPRPIRELSGQCH